MGRTINGGGDQLARGAARVSFRQPDVSEEKYNEATEGFDLERFLKGDKPKVTGEKEISRKGR